MPHWAEKYVGIKHVDGVFDCADLAKQVQAEVFNKQIKLPAHRDYSGKAGEVRREAIARQIDSVKGDYAMRVDSPVEGDGVLMLDGTSLSHIGTYCFINGEGWVLHSSRRFGISILCRIRELRLHNLRVEGYYRWI